MPPSGALAAGWLGPTDTMGAAWLRPSDTVAVGWILGMLFGGGACCCRLSAGGGDEACRDCVAPGRPPNAPGGVCHCAVASSG